MANVFYTKKAKAKMRARRRKQMKASEGDETKNSGGERRENGSTMTTDTDGKQHTLNNAQGGRNSRKRSAAQISSSSDGKNANSNNGHQATSTTTITIPANLTPKEAKKFRKDARRKARAQGQAEDQLHFIIEGQPLPTKKVDDNDGNGDGDDKNKHKKKKTKQSFPRINDLLTQHAEEQKRAAKRAKQTSSDAALPPSETQKYVAIDCEMVGIGIDGKKSALARASVVDWDGTVLLDVHVRVPERVTDFRTSVSGIRPKDIHARNEAALEHDECRTKVGQLLHNKVLVGHALKNDLSALMLTHPREDIRDTARYKPFMRATGRSGGKLRPRKLRDLVYEELGKRIQVEGSAHSSVEDARATMDLFRCVRGRWEKELMEKSKKKKGKKKVGGGDRGEK